MSRVYHTYGNGRVDVFPFKMDDYLEIKRQCLVRRDKAMVGSEEYHRWYRNYMIIYLGVNLGCRIEVLLQLTPKHVSGGMARIKEYKTNKVSKFDMSAEVYKELEEFIKYLKITDNEYIFKTSMNKDKPYDRTSAYKMIKQIAKDCGINYAVGCHSLRKSFGRFIYDDTNDIYLVQRLLQHSTSKTTEQYICLNQDEVEKGRKKYNF